MLPVQLSPTVCGLCWTPVPDKLIAVGEPVALLIKLRLPLTAPPVTGANWTVTGTDWPAVRVSLELTPLTVKPAPDILTADIVTLEFPVFVRAALKLSLLPTFTLPKLILDVLKVSK